MHYEAELGMCAHVQLQRRHLKTKGDYLTEKSSSLRQLLLSIKKMLTIMTR